MLIRHTRPFNTGIALAITFVGILIVIFMPIFGGGRIGLNFSDDLFNSLSKGSSYFIPEVARNVEAFKGKDYAVVVKVDKPEKVAKVVKIYQVAGAMVGTGPSETEVKIAGDLGKVLDSVLKDSDSMFYNKGSEVSARYGFDEKEVMKLWWTTLNASVKELQKQKKLGEANIIAEVDMKAVEPAFNYYKIEPQKVADRALTMGGLLVFYVGYTLWWGYAIFYLFEGIGLSMKKAKVKKEI